MRAARRCSGQVVTSTPSSISVPASTGNPPATAFNKVDLPDPLVPMTTTNEPSLIERSTPLSARTSFGVPPLNVLKAPRICSIASDLDRAGASLYASDERWQDECEENEPGCHELQIVRVKSAAQGKRHD